MQGIDDSFALKVIVGDDEGIRRMFGDSADAGRPGIKFLRRIKIIVSFTRGRDGIVAEPGVVAAAVQADIADRRSTFRRRFKRTSNDRLIDVTEARMMLAK